MLTTALAFALIMAFASIVFPKFKISLSQLTAVFVLALIVTAFPSFAQDAVAVVEDPTVPPEWLSGVLIWISQIPTVGPIAVTVFKWLGVVASIFTALSVALTVIAKVPEIALRFVKLPELADKVAKFNEKIQPYLKFLSVFNSKSKK